MQITVYLDLIFIMNYLVDFFVLLITGCMFRQKISILRIGLGSLFGATAFLPFIFYPDFLVGFSGIVLTVGISMGAVAISLGRSGGFVRKWLLSTTITFLLGGMIQYVKAGQRVIHITFYKWMMIFLLCMIAGSILLYLLSESDEKRKYIYTVKIKHNERVVTENVLMDSGNRLWDSLYRKPVMVLSEDAVRRIVSKEEYDYIEKYNREGFINYNDCSFINVQKSMCFHEIPFQSVGRLSGKLLCFIIDSVEVVGREKYYYKQPIAVADEKLFQKKEYKGLIFSDKN